MHKVQATSDAWEAVYTEKPPIDPACDWVFFLDGKMIAIVAGYLVGSPQIASIEVLAIDPDYQGRGLLRPILKESFRTLHESVLEMHFATRSAPAVAAYKKLNLEPRPGFKLHRDKKIPGKGVLYEEHIGIAKGGDDILLFALTRDHPLVKT